MGLAVGFIPLTASHVHRVLFPLCQYTILFFRLLKAFFSRSLYDVV